MGYATEQPQSPTRQTPRQKIRMAKEKRRTSKKAFLDRFERLKTERSTWMPHYKEVAELTIPRRIRTFYESRQKGEKVNQKIINSTPTRALRILTSGMMSGISSPARPWFRLITPYSDLMAREDVRLWLNDVEDRMRTVFSRSNIYNTLALTYRDLGNYGTAAMCVEEDDEDVIRGYSYTPGTYVVQNSPRMTVDTIYHELPLTVGQIADRFGLDNASPGLKAKWEQNDIDSPVRVLHCIEPNEVYDSTQLGKAGKKFRSVWLEADSADNTDSDKYLGEGNGYNEFPAMVPRWDLNAEEIYGSSPAMEALGDMKALQQLERRKLSAIDKIVNPPMVGPISLAREKRSTLSGDVTFVEGGQGAQKFEPAYLIDSRVLFLKEEIANHERRIMQAFYADLFLMLANADQGQPITAREVQERHEEKMLQLGPVLERLHDELLTPLIERTFEIMLRAGLIPPPPQELSGFELRVEFISILAQAQKLLGTVASERLLGITTTASQVFPEAVDKLDIDEFIDDYASMLGTNPKLVVSGDKLKAKRDARAKQQQMAAMAQAAGPMKDASQAAVNMQQTDRNQPGTINSLISAIQPNQMPATAPTAL